MPHKVKFSDFDPARVIFGKIDEKQTVSAGQTIKYYIIPIQYLYEITAPNGEKREVKDVLYIEGPKMKSRGPQNRTYEDKNRSVWSIYSRFDLSNPEHEAFVSTSSEKPGTMHAMALKCCDFVFENKVKFNVKCSKAESMIDIIHYPIRWPENDLNSSDNPSAVFKLMRYGKDPSNMRETSFYLPINGGKKIAWDTIMQSNIIHEPLLKFDNITVASGRPSIKFEMVSSIIHDIIPSGGENMQQDTLENAAKDTNTEILEARVRELEARLVSTGPSKEPILANATPVAPIIPTSPAEIPGIGKPATMHLQVEPIPVAPVAPVMSMDAVLNAAPPPIALPAIPATPLPPSLPGLPGLPALP